MNSNTLGRALQYAGGTHTLEDIAQGVAEGRFQEWGSDDSVIVTEIRETPRHKYVHFFLAEGHMPEIQAMVPAILDWARSIGCTRASLAGRRGWERVPWMRADGWRYAQTVMEKTL